MIWKAVIIFCFLRPKVCCLEISVIEFSEPIHKDTFPRTIIRDNYQHMCNLIDTAVRQRSNVIIFPECSLGGYKSYGLLKDQLIQYAYKLPGKNTSAENLTSYKKEFKGISELARLNQVHIIINLIEKKKQKEYDDFYNSNVIFSDNGTFLKAVRKQHLCFERNFLGDNTTDIDCVVNIQNTTFCVLSATDFFDQDLVNQILLKHEVKNIILTNAWYTNNTDIPYLINNLVLFKYLSLKHNVTVFFAGLNINNTERKCSGMFSEKVDISDCSENKSKLLHGKINTEGILSTTETFEKTCSNDEDVNGKNCTSCVPCNDLFTSANIKIRTNINISLICYNKTVTISAENITQKTEIEISLIGIIVEKLEMGTYLNLEINETENNNFKPLLIDTHLEYYTGENIVVNGNNISVIETDPDIHFLGFLSWIIKKPITGDPKYQLENPIGANNNNTNNRRARENGKNYTIIICIVVLILAILLLLCLLYCYKKQQRNRSGSQRG